MTTETAHGPWSGENSPATRVMAELDTRGGGDPVEELDRAVAAVGTLLNWHSAVCVRYSPMHMRPGVAARSWTRDPDVLVPPLPQWLERLAPNSWGPRKLVWRPALAPDPYLGAVVAVPLVVDGDVIGALVYFGPRLREPDESALGLLRAVADALAPVIHRTRIQAVTSRQDEQEERPLSLIDVFAFTVRVSRDGTSFWEYFGPNSHAIFGEGIYPDEPLTKLLARYADPEDLEDVHCLAQALNEGHRTESEMRIIGSDGVTRWVSVRIEPRWAEGTLFVDGVATDVSARRAVERSSESVGNSPERAQSLREHALNVREANDAVLQRLFAAGLRLQMLKSKLGEAEAHAVTAISFQLDQAATDLREIIQGLNAVATDPSID